MKKKSLLLLSMLIVLPLVSAGILDDFFDWLNGEDEFDDKYWDSNSPNSYMLVTERDLKASEYQIIETEHINFDLPKSATHYWTNESLDTYEIIINVSIKGYDDYWLKFNWKDNRYLDESFQIFYDFKDGVMNKEDISFNKLAKDSKLTFENMDIQIGEEIGTKYELIGSLNVSSPIRSWSEFDKIDLKNNLSFRAIDDINVSACGTLATAGETFILNQSITASGLCFIFEESGTLDGAGFDITGDGISGAGIINPGISSTIIKNFGNISNFGTGISYSGASSSIVSLVFNNTISSNVLNGISVVRIDDINITSNDISNSGQNDIRLTIGAMGIIVLDTTYNIEFVSTSGKQPASELIRKWSYQTFVNDTNGNPVNNANVKAWNESNEIEFSILTDSSGQTTTSGILTDYVNFGGVRTFTQPFTITAVNESSVGFQRSYNVSFEQMNLFNVITIDVEVPLISFDSSTDEDGDTKNTNIFVNASANDTHSNISTFIDFDNSLIGWWRMDDLNSSGDVVDFFGKNNGSVVGGAVQVDNGRLGKAFDFDGSTGYINLGNSTALNDFTNQITLSAWIKTTGTTMTIVGKSHNNTHVAPFYKYRIGVTGSGKADIRIDSDKVNSLVDVNDNQWHLVTGTYNSTNISIYIDGVFSFSEGATGDIQKSSRRTVISGRDTDVMDEFFDGLIDDVMIFNRSLSAVEIMELYTNTAPRHVQETFDNLDIGDHTFTAYTQDFAGNVNQTEERTVDFQCWNSGSLWFLIPPTCPFIPSEIFPNVMI